jgi:putative iron-regulated protein
MCMVASGLLGCSAPEDETEAPIAEAVANYSAIVHASYADSFAEAEQLDAAVRAFVDAPDADTMEAARDAWRASREPYLQTEVYRFYDGPIDNPDDGPEGLLNAWPLDEAYIDYVDGSPDSGIVNDLDVTIDETTLVDLNEAGGEKNIATGYHAVEFLLWGQDFNEDAPGDRPVSDYTTGGDAPNPERRAEYLTTTSGLIVEHLEQLQSAWAPDADNYRAEFEAEAPGVGLRRILTGMIVLSGFETGGERLQTALDSGDQEDEHSCFSDNTHRDMVQDVRGIQNVYLGEYERLDGSKIEGVGIYDVVATRDQGLADELKQQIATALEDAEALQPPFDQEIDIGNAEGRQRVEDLILSLREVEDLLEDAFRLFEFDIPEAG